MATTRLDSLVLKEVRQRLESCCKDLGLAIRVGNIKYSATTFRCSRIEGALINEQEAPEVDPEKDPYGAEINAATPKIENPKDAIDRQHWIQYCRQYGFSPDDWGKEVQINAGRLWGTYKLHSIKPRSRKYPIIVKARDGRLWKVPKSFINISR